MKEISRLSYSSLSTYAECGERWRLERGYGLGRSTWYATVAGSAIHEITEQIDLDQEVWEFKRLFDQMLDREEQNGVEVKPSGRKLSNIGKMGGPNKKDYDWWLIYGPQYVENYRMWRKLTGWELIDMPDGKPAVEVPITVNMGGGTHLGYIDRVFVTPDGELVVVDIKTGATPVSKLQLGVYAVALWKEFGLLAELGAYWMAGDGEVTGPFLLSNYTEEWIDHQYEMAWAGINAGVFLPNVTAMCKGCGVRDWCRAVGGQRAGDELVQPDQLFSRVGVQVVGGEG